MSYDEEYDTFEDGLTSDDYEIPWRLRMQYANSMDPEMQDEEEDEHEIGMRMVMNMYHSESEEEEEDEYIPVVLGKRRNESVEDAGKKQKKEQLNTREVVAQNSSQSTESAAWNAFIESEAYLVHQAKIIAKLVENEVDHIFVDYVQISGEEMYKYTHLLTEDICSNGIHVSVRDPMIQMSV
jgi:methanogenic corrinoid protein MtbC1